MKRLLTSPLLAGALAVAVGCGGSGGDPDADLSSVVPARALVFLEANVKPDGETGDDVRALAEKLGGTDDPGGRLKQLIERELREEDPDFSYAKDVEPWLGDRIGVFVERVSTTGGDGDAAVVAATTDADKARETLEREIAERDEGEPAPRVADRSHRGVDFKVEAEDDQGVAIVGDLVVVGTERAIKAAIDASEGESLAEADKFKKARDQVSDEAVGFGYVAVDTLLSSIGPQGAAARQLLGQSGDTAAFALDADPDAIRLETAGLGAEGAGAAGGPGEVLTELPGDAWLAAGTAAIGKQLERSLQQVGQLGAFGGFDIEQVLGQVESQTGIDVREDLLSWMGDGAIFVRGETLGDIGGALVVNTTDPVTTARVIPRVARLISQAAPGTRVSPLSRGGVDEGVTIRAAQLPLPVHMAVAGDRFIVAVTDGALDAALQPQGRLADSAAFKAATGKLGEGIEPAFFADFDPIRKLVDGTGAVQGAEAEEARRVLDRLTSVVAGSQREDDVQRGRLVVGVK